MIWILLLFLCDANPCKVEEMETPGILAFESEQGCQKYKDDLEELTKQRYQWGIKKRAETSTCIEIIVGRP